MFFFPGICLFAIAPFAPGYFLFYFHNYVSIYLIKFLLLFNDDKNQQLQHLKEYEFRKKREKISPKANI